MLAIEEPDIRLSRDMNVPWTECVAALLHHYIVCCDLSEGIPYDKKPFEDLKATTTDCISAYGLDVEDVYLKHAVNTGVTIACTAYKHLTCKYRRRFVAVFSALAAYVDGICELDPNVVEDVASFGADVMAGRPSRSLGLRALQMETAQANHLYDSVSASIIMISALKFVAGTAIEALPSLQTHTSPEAACYLRAMTGIPELFTVCIFPASVSYDDYKDALPSIGDFIDLHNDLLSFYKEESAGEKCNLASYLNMNRGGASKIDVLEWIMERSLACYKRALQLLVKEDAKTALRAFAQGYLDFHLQSKRYRLAEIGLGIYSKDAF
ncbi:terpenoid synthase [Cylindrobasidium torrendii FP15055 ss-10]|uniref:Terpenoid synthase n=1 Tax=Cylindrobasidium torrendii FP15055 ss-10 TaxID=1314674 RepID=A0A0D7BP13_9AGAR|nr:terpenoid synthase [Cylindrobasidium torrendii FP15055 ss-10]